MLPKIKPVVTHDNSVTTITINWEREPIALIAEAQRRVQSICAKYDEILSCRSGAGGVTIRLNIGTDSTAPERVAELLKALLADDASWKPIVKHPKLPRDLMVIKGNHDGRTWDYSRQLTDTECEYAE